MILSSRTWWLVTLLFLFTLFVVQAYADDPQSAVDARLRAAVKRALDPIQASVREYPSHRNCFSCHHQGVPALALRVARQRSFDVSEDCFDAIDVVTIA